MPRRPASPRNMPFPAALYNRPTMLVIVNIFKYKSNLTVNLSSSSNALSRTHFESTVFTANNHPGLRPSQTPLEFQTLSEAAVLLDSALRPCATRKQILQYSLSQIVLIHAASALTLSVTS